eukprot:TRINITY_DN795_c0_g1_i8.p17 TRINITY_DN795_c0_g1~~TRINITY_DN795_c0_g1_i8.p17  ORF type:complete len:105 (+),score=4.05 TRINITY_DN795_c0_g1_i8:2697-3011(+)
MHVCNLNQRRCMKGETKIKQSTKPIPNFIKSIPTFLHQNPANNNFQVRDIFIIGHMAEFNRINNKKFLKNLKNSSSFSAMVRANSCHIYLQQKRYYSPQPTIHP